MDRPVVFVESYPDIFAGQQKTLTSLLEHWESSGGSASVIVPTGGAFADFLENKGVDVWKIQQPGRLGRYGGAVYHDGVKGKVANTLQAARYVRQIRSVLQQRRVRGVFCNDMRGILTVGVAARSLGIPVMTWDKLDKPHGKLDLIELPLLNRVAIISNAVLNKFPAWQISRYQHKIELVPNGADVSHFGSATIDRAAYGLQPEDIAIGVVGTVCERKGHDRMLTVFPELIRRCPNAVLIIAGSSPDSAEGRDYVSSLPHRDHPRVRFLGQRDDIPQLMASLDLFAIPSRHEGMGQVTVEAMACSLPVVGARAGGIPEVVVHGETGLLFEGDDPEDLLECLTRLCQDANLRKKMGQRGRERAQCCYDRPVQMAKICDIFKRLVA